MSTASFSFFFPSTHWQEGTINGHLTPPILPLSPPSKPWQLSYLPLESQEIFQRTPHRTGCAYGMNSNHNGIGKGGRKWGNQQNHPRTRPHAFPWAYCRESSWFLVITPISLSTPPCTGPKDASYKLLHTHKDICMGVLQGYLMVTSIVWFLYPYPHHVQEAKTQVTDKLLHTYKYISLGVLQGYLMVPGINSTMRAPGQSHNVSGANTLISTHWPTPPEKELLGVFFFRHHIELITAHSKEMQETPASISHNPPFTS